MSTPAKKNSSVLGLIGLFTVWYVFNAGYNVYNAKLKTDLKFPVIISCLQLAVGLLYAIPLWLLQIRTLPELTIMDLVRLFPIAALNALGHSTTVVAMFQLGGGSFTHVIKASEPVVSVVLGLLINGATHHCAESPAQIVSKTLLTDLLDVRVLHRGDNPVHRARPDQDQGFVLDGHVDAMAEDEIDKLKKHYTSCN